MLIFSFLPIKFHILNSFLSNHFFLRIPYSKILIERFFENFAAPFRINMIKKKIISPFKNLQNGYR